MKHFAFKEHTEECIKRSKEHLLSGDDMRRSFGRVCELNHDHVLFYHAGDFYLLSLHGCWMGYDRNAAILDILNRAGLKVKLIKQFNRDYNLDERFKKARLSGAMLDDEVTEVNYIYYGVGKIHSITSVISISDAISGQESYRKNYDEMTKYLTDNGFEYLIRELKQLYDNNWILIPNEVEIIKSIENIIKHVNGNDQKDELKGTVKARIQHNDAVKRKGYIRRGSESTGQFAETV